MALTFDHLLRVLARSLAPYSRRANRPSQTEVGSGMTDIDPKSDIELHAVNEHVMVRVPLAGRVTGEWLRRYQRPARALIAEADAGERAPSAAQAEGIVRDWWARRRESAPRRPVSRIEIARTGIGTEKRWPLLGALAAAIAVPLLLPARFSVGPD